MKKPNARCLICHGEGWVCENHSFTGWDEGDGCECGGAGAPCRCNTSNPPWHHLDERGATIFAKVKPEPKRF